MAAQAPMTLYSNAEVHLFCDAFSGLMTQESSVSVQKKSGLNMVFTTVNGLAGATQGAATVEIKVENAIPSADFEVLPDSAMFLGEVCEIWIVMAGVTSKHKVFITEADFSHSVNDSSKLSMSFTGRFAEFE